MSEINIYCDETCHLPHDGIDLMVIGGISCPKEKVAEINRQIRRIKEAHHVYKFAEIKWVRVSNSQYDMYKELVDLFFDNSFLNFRAVVAKNKSKLDYQRFHLTHDDWYQRIYYLTLREMIDINNSYHVYVDIKDTKGAEKINTLRDVLNRATAYFFNETVKNIQLLRSDQVQIMQLTDLMIGAVAYANRGLDGSVAKLNLISHIEERARRGLTMTSPKDEVKCNIFHWLPREVE